MDFAAKGLRPLLVLEGVAMIKVVGVFACCAAVAYGLFVLHLQIMDRHPEFFAIAPMD